MNSFCNISTFFSVKGFFQNEFKLYFNKNKSDKQLSPNLTRSKETLMCKTIRFNY